jgi:hypothetical protein
MGKPFNFFGYRSPAFVLNGAFLFDDNFDYVLNFSGLSTGLSLDVSSLKAFTSGEYLKDVEPDLNTLSFNYHADFENPSIDLTNFDFNITGELADAVHIDRTDLGINFYAEYVKEPVYKFSLLNNVDTVELTGMSEDRTSLSNNLSEVELSGEWQREDLSLLNSIPSGSLQGEAHLLDNYNLNFSWNATYQKDPD